ncbi:MAG: hypothetical protein ACLUJG_01545 [Lawsonibacter sp.]
MPAQSQQACCSSDSLLATVDELKSCCVPRRLLLPGWAVRLDGPEGRSCGTWG